MILVHGTNKTDWAAHVGMCLTDCERAASVYGSTLHEIDLCTAGLVVTEVEGYDRDANVAPGDDDDARDWDGHDVLVYDDEDATGRTHRTWRLVSIEAVQAIRSTRVLAAQD